MAIDPMAAMVMMNGGLGQGGSGSENETDGPQNDMMPLLKLLAPELFGEEIVESVWEDAVPFGSTTARSGDPTIGLISVMVIPATPDSPVARLRINANGNIYARPEHLEKLAGFFQRMAKSADLAKAFEEEKEKEAAMAQQGLTSKVLKAGV